MSNKIQKLTREEQLSLALLVLALIAGLDRIHFAKLRTKSLKSKSSCQKARSALSSLRDQLNGEWWSITHNPAGQDDYGYIYNYITGRYSCFYPESFVTDVNDLIPPSSICSLLYGTCSFSIDLIIILLGSFSLLLLSPLVKLIDSKAMQLIKTIYKIYLPQYFKFNITPPFYFLCVISPTVMPEIGD